MTARKRPLTMWRARHDNVGFAWLLAITLLSGGCAARQPAILPAAEAIESPTAGAPDEPLPTVAAPRDILTAAAVDRPRGECGVERWPVKTLTDDLANRVQMRQVVRTTIATINRIAEHCRGIPDSRTFPQEFQLIEVEGIIQKVLPEDDRDFHIVLKDPDARATMVVELSDPRCARGSPHLQLIRGADEMFDQLLNGGSFSSLIGKRVRVRGVGFFDRFHNQTGMARSCLELHPVLFIRAVR